MNQEECYVYGMLAFPLLELGRMDEAEAAARKGLAIYKEDIWAQHNVSTNNAHQILSVLQLSIQFALLSACYLAL